MKTEKCKLNNANVNLSWSFSTEQYSYVQLEETVSPKEQISRIQ